MNLEPLHRIRSEEAKPDSLPSDACPEATHTRLDRLGMWLSGACAVHCMVMPIVLILFPVMMWIRWSRLVDVITILAAAMLGLGGCVLSFRVHRDHRPLSLVMGGLLLHGTGRLASSALGLFLSQSLIIAGPMLMGYGLWRDRRLCRWAGQRR